MAGMDLPTLEAAVAANPDDMTAWANLAAAYYEQARFEAALDAFREAAGRQPGDVRLWLGMGRSALQLQRAEVVEEAVAQAFEADPNHPELYRLVCDAASSAEQLSDRLVGAARYLQLAPDAEDHDTYVEVILSTLATVADYEPWRAGDVLESMPYLEAVVPAESLAPLAERLIIARDRASETAAVAQDIDSRLADAWALLGAQPAAALEAFQSLATEIAGVGDDRTAPLADQAASAYNGLAQALAACAPADGADRLAHLEIALEAADEAASRAPQVEQAYRASLQAEVEGLRAGAVGHSVYDLGHGEQPAEPAVASAYDVEDGTTEAVVMPPLDPEPVAEPVEAAAPVPEVAPEPATEPVAAPDAPRVVLVEDEWLALLDEAWTEAEGGNLEEARIAFETVLDKVAERRIRARALAGLGRVELGLGRGDDAMQRTEEALGQDGSCGQAHLVRALIAETKHDWARALQAYQFAEATLHDDVRVLRGVGLALCERGDYDEAIDPLTAALAQSPDEVELVVALGRCYLGTHQLPQASACLEAAEAMGLSDALAALVTRLSEQVSEAASRPTRPAPKAAAADDDEEYDPDTAAPDARRSDDDRHVRDRVLKRAGDMPDYDPEAHDRCPVCRYPNPKDTARCRRCGHNLTAPPPPPPRPAGRPCFVATAACGDPWAPEVVALRQWRDTRLCLTPAGRMAIRWYDRCSPPLARFIASRRWLADLVRRRLIVPLAERLSRLGAER